MPFMRTVIIVSGLTPGGPVPFMRLLLLFQV